MEIIEFPLVRRTRGTDYIVIIKYNYRFPVVDCCSRQPAIDNMFTFSLSKTYRLNVNLHERRTCRFD